MFRCWMADVSGLVQGFRKRNRAILYGLPYMGRMLRSNQLFCDSVPATQGRNL